MSDVSLFLEFWLIRIGESGSGVTVLWFNLKFEVACGAVLCCVLSHVWPFVTPWTVAHQALLSMEFYRQEYYGGLPLPPLMDLPNSGIEPCLLCLLHWPEDSLPTALPGEPPWGHVGSCKNNQLRKEVEPSIFYCLLREWKPVRG